LQKQWYGNFFIISNDLTALPVASIEGCVVRPSRRLEEDYAWLKELAGEGLTGDEAKALIYARETGVVNNTACRDFSGLDTLQASSLLRRLRDRGLLEKQGRGAVPIHPDFAT